MQYQTASILYDLAMTMAGETRPRPLSVVMLQRFLTHTGCACGAVLLNCRSIAEGRVTAEVYAAIGNRSLHLLEGQISEWPSSLLEASHAESGQGWFSGGSKYTHALNLLLPGLGHVLLFSMQAPSESALHVVTLFPPILAKLARSLRLCLDSEEHEKALAIARDEAEEGSRAKSRFLASMSHELRTPLNAIIGYTQLMEMFADLPASQRENVHEISRAGQHLLTLVNDILDLARIESGKLEFQLGNFDLVDVLAECRAQNIGAAEVKNITLAQAGNCGVFHVNSDYRRLLQALNNLVSNAIKYNRENGSVTLSCSAPATGRVKIAVADTGPGIAPDVQMQLFQPFNRLGAERGAVEGTGIGLVITRELVAGMGGAVGVESKPGIGSTFWLEIPTVAHVGPQEPPASSDTPAESGCLKNGARVLVAEDYAPNQALLRLQLGSLGYEVEIANDGAVALDKWLKGRHDLILSDLNMPVMDGLALAQAVRRHEKDGGRHTPIVAITAAAEPSELKRCRDAGMDDVLTKPIALDGLRNVLARWTGSAALPADAPYAPEEGLDVEKQEGEAQILDLDHLYRILGNASLKHARELVSLFLQSAAEGLDSLSSRPDIGAAVALEMHKQKSSARTVGALRYARHAEEQERRAKAGKVIAIEVMRDALAQVKAEAGRLDADDLSDASVLPRESAIPSVSCASILVVDDDPVVLRQMVTMLGRLGVKEVLTADNGMDALKVMGERGGEFELLVCDLSMPEMDGVELIRLFGQTGFHGGLILMSGADEKVISTASELAARQGLRVLGQVQKPVAQEKMAQLLVRLEDAPIRKRRQMEVAEVTSRDIRKGIDGDEFTIWFQPKVDAASLVPVGVEALARWRRHDGSFVPPDVFIVVAEQEGLIGELSQVLVSRALMEAARLHDAGFSLKIAVNLSGRWLNDLNLPDFMLATAQAAGLHAHDVILEVTETGVMEDLTTALDVLTRVRIKGFGLSIDDFGIGYSSFEQLGRIPFTELKLDRSFVTRGNHDASARAILEGSMDMARKMGLASVAEGVELETDLALIRTLGCDLVQGYLIAKPMPTESLISWLREAKHRGVAP